MFEHRDVAYERARRRLVAKLLLGVVIVILGTVLLPILPSFTIRVFTDPVILTFLGVVAMLNSIALLPMAVHIWLVSRAKPQTLPRILLVTIGALVGTAFGILAGYSYIAGGPMITGFFGWGLGVMIAKRLGNSNPVIEKDLTKLLL